MSDESIYADTNQSSTAVHVYMSENITQTSNHTTQSPTPPAQATSYGGLSSEQQEGPKEPVKLYSGLIKSFNARRGFGFIVCDETAEEYRRDVFISKAERDRNSLYEGDPCVFELQFSVEGHPQAVNVDKIQRYQGRVIGYTYDSGYTHDRLLQLGPIDRNGWPNGKNTPEIYASKADTGICVLYPNDKISFQVMNRDQSAGRMMAGMILLQDTASSSSLSSCFEVEAPLFCRGHTIGNEVYLRLPQGLDVELLKKVLPKIGASNISISDDLSSARASFASLQALIKVLNHRSLGLPTVEGGNAVAAVQMRPPTSQKESFWNAPALTRIHNELTWDPQPNAQSYTLEVRLPSSSSWITLDAGGKPTPLASLNSHITSVSIASLGPVLEARLSYATLCGCISGFGTINNMNAIVAPYPKAHHKLPAPPAPEILRHTQTGVSIRWAPLPEVHEYIIETIRTNGEFFVKTVSGQSYVELQGSDHLWARLAYVDVKLNLTSPYSAKLVIPPGSACTWTVDEVTGLPRRRCSWDQRREPLTLWLN